MREVPRPLPLSTSTAILARLFARFEGGGELMASVPGGMRDLAQRLVDPEAPEGEELVVARRIGGESRLVFGVRGDARRWIRSVVDLDPVAVDRDRCALGEMLSRIAAGRVETRPLLGEEMAHLQRCLGVGKWCSGLAMVAEED